MDNLGVVTVIILLPLFYLGISFYVDALKYKMIENYYHENKESFNSIVEYYDNLYQENLYEVKYDCDNSYQECKLKYILKKDITEMVRLWELILLVWLLGNHLLITGIRGQGIVRLDDKDCIEMEGGKPVSQIDDDEKH